MDGMNPNVQNVQNVAYSNNGMLPVQQHQNGSFINYMQNISSNENSFAPQVPPL